MKIFSYDELIRKAHREIGRLTEAEKSLDDEAAIDYALNAAFTIYHLIQWGQKAGKIQLTNKVQDYLTTTNNQGLKILHSVVTCNKHVTVSQPVYSGVTAPAIEDNIDFIITEDGNKITTDYGSPLVTEESNIKVKFGDLDASSVLVEALAEFP